MQTLLIQIYYIVSPLTNSPPVFSASLDVMRVCANTQFRASLNWASRAFMPDLEKRHNPWYSPASEMKVEAKICRSVLHFAQAELSKSAVPQNLCQTMAREGVALAVSTTVP